MKSDCNLMLNSCDIHPYASKPLFYIVMRQFSPAIPMRPDPLFCVSTYERSARVSTATKNTERERGQGEWSIAVREPRNRNVYGADDL